jgi:small subunit ribosomal protein S3e
LTVSGKIRGQRAKSMKFVDGVMLHSGEATTDYVQTAVRHVLLRQGVLGLKVKIMLPHDACGIKGPARPLPDHIDIAHPKDTAPIADPFVNDWTKEEVHSCAHACGTRTHYRKKR